MDTPTHFIVIGDADDIPFLSASLERLPSDSYGQVFVEVRSSAQIEDFSVPEGVSIMWLVNPDHHTGHRLLPAVHAWVAEWSIPGEPADSYLLWIGCALSPALPYLHLAVHSACSHRQGD